MTHTRTAHYHQVKVQKWPYVLLWALCILGSWAVLPYLLYLSDLPLSASLLGLFVGTTVRTALLFALVCFFSYLIVPKTDLMPLAFDRFFRRILYPGVVGGLCTGLFLYLLDHTVFRSSLLVTAHPPAWAGVLGSFYGAINEEVLLRLFLFTGVYFLLGRALSSGLKFRLLCLWITNVIVATLFGLGHLPAAFKLMTPSSFEVFRILLLNGIPGIVFGWLYWSRGLAAAMTAHFIADLMIHVVLI